MGIKALNPFLREKCPEAFVDLPISYFKGKRIAIDSDQILRKFRARAYKEIVDKTDVCVEEPDIDEVNKRWKYHVKNFILSLLKVGATPVFIFDGKYIDEKSETQEKRRADKKKMIDDAEALKMKILEVDELERTPAMITELRKKMHHLGFLSSDEKEAMMGILSAIGIPVLKATGEGEQLCAMLCIEGKVEAVYSTDTDLVAFGCPLTINESGGYLFNPKTGMTEETFKCTLFKPILSSLGLTYESFRDLCIMSGCDFNTNIRLVGVGRSYNLIKDHGSIDNLPVKYDKTCLNHIRCREILGHYPSEKICQDELVLNINTDLEDARDRLDMYGAEDWLRDITPLYFSLPTPNDNYIPKIPSLNSSKLKLVINSSSEIKNDLKGSESGSVPILIVNGMKKSSPKQINQKTINELNSNQHKRLAEKYGNKNVLNISKPKLQIINK